MEFIDWIFDHSSFIKRDCCVVEGTMPAWIKYSMIVSDATIAIAYLVIATMMLTILFRAKSTMVKIFGTTIYLYFSFIILCGFTHFIDMLAFYTPFYRANAIARIATALVSLATIPYLIHSINIIERSPDVIGKLLRERNTQRIERGEA